MKKFFSSLISLTVLLAFATPSRADPVPPSGAPNFIGDIAPIGYQVSTTSWKYLQFDASGALVVTGGGGGGGGTSSTFGAAFPATGTALGVKDSTGTNMTFAKVNLSNALLVDGSAVTQPVSISGNQAVNQTQVNGVTVSVGNGTTDTGTQRVTLSSDSTGQVKLATGSNTIGALTANQSVNLVQVNGSTVSLGQTAAASSLPVAFANEDVQDLYFTGQSAQTATINNIIPATASANATDVTGYQSGSVQVVSTGTGGTFIFEGSNDNTNFQTIPVFNQAIVTGVATTAAVTATASQFIYTFPIQFRYVRLRIATTITGGSIQAFSTFKRANFNNAVTSVASPTTANNLGNSNLVSINGTATVTGGVAGILAVGGNVAISSAATANPIGVGGRVITTLDTSLTQGDVSAQNYTTAGQLVIKPYGSAENDWQYATPIASPITNTTAVAMKAAGAASIRNYVTSVQYQNTSATASIVTIQDGVTVIWTGYAPASMAVPAVVTFNTPLRGTAATAMNFVVNTTATNTFVSAQGYQSF